MTVANTEESAALVERLRQVGRELLQELPDYREYIELQETWNAPMLQYASRWMPAHGARVCSIGSFLGAPELALAATAREVVCCDMKDFLPRNRPSNVRFHQLNLDAAALNLPEGQFDACFIIEVLEHLRWSPLPLLEWARDNCNLLVISTPDDREWPAMEEGDWTTRAHFLEIPGAVPGAPGNPKPMSHCKQYSQHEFMELLDYSGFRVVEVQRVGGGGHQMLAIAQVRLDERGTPLLPRSVSSLRGSLSKWQRLVRRKVG